jgi:hypothetical protein
MNTCIIGFHNWKQHKKPHSEHDSLSKRELTERKCTKCGKRQKLLIEKSGNSLMSMHWVNFSNGITDAQIKKRSKDLTTIMLGSLLMFIWLFIYVIDKTIYAGEHSAPKSFLIIGGTLLVRGINLFNSAAISWMLPYAGN